MKKESIGYILGFLAAIGVGTAITANAQNEPSPSPSPSVSPSVTATPATQNYTFNDQLALNFLHHVNTHEIEEAVAAQAKITTPAVSNAVQQLLTDHQQLETQVIQLAAQKNIPLFNAQRATYELAAESYLEGLTGTEFEQAYMQLQQQNHQAVITRLQLMLNQVNDQDIKNLINQAIPVIQSHIELASSEAPGTAASPQPSISVTDTPTNTGTGY